MRRMIIKGNILNPVSYDEIEVKKQHFIIIEDGIIKGIHARLPEEYQHADVIDVQDDLIIPAFSDLHIHASQFAERGTGMDCLLFDWLNNYTFPQESKFGNIDYARSIYNANNFARLVLNRRTHD